MSACRPTAISLPTPTTRRWRSGCMSSYSERVWRCSNNWRGGRTSGTERQNRTFCLVARATAGCIRPAPRSPASLDLRVARKGRLQAWVGYRSGGVCRRHQFNPFCVFMERTRGFAADIHAGRGALGHLEQRPIKAADSGRGCSSLVTANARETRSGLTCTRRPPHCDTTPCALCPAWNCAGGSPAPDSAQHRHQQAA